MQESIEGLEGKYEILEKLREGGMGSVYKVRHRLLDEVRVVKVMRPHLAGDEVLRARFLREAKVAVRLRHRNLAQIYDFSMDERGYAFLVMEFIDGLNLNELSKVIGPPSLGLGLEIAAQGLDVLGYLHRKEVVHRDVSPDNFLLTRDDHGRPLVKIIDLGIAKVSKSESNLTAAGTFLGKVRYSSPEHFDTREQDRVGPHSDLYSFGVLLYELITGSYPIRGTGVASLIAGHVTQPPMPFDQSDPDGKVPEELRSALMRAMSKQPSDRFESAEAFKVAIEDLHRAHRIDPQEIDRAFTVPTVPTQRLKTSKPGSTQSHLDRSFRLSDGPTPAGEDSRDLDLETSQTEAVRDPTDGDELLEAVDQRQRLLAEVTDAVEDLLGRDEFDAAEQRIAEARREFPDEALIDELEARAAEARQAQLRARTEALREEARELLTEDRFQEAIARLEAAVELIDDEEATLDLLAGARDKLAVQQRQARVEELSTAVESLTAAGRTDQALERLSAAEAELGDFDEAATLRASIERAVEERRDCLRKVTALIESARDHVAENRFEEANRALQELRGQARDHPEFGPDVEAVEAEVARHLEEYRRRTAVARATDSIRERIAGGALEEAEREFKLAARLYGEEAFLTARRALEDAEIARQAQDAEQLRRSALAEDASFDDVRATLREALELDPHNLAVHRLLADTESASRRAREQAAAAAAAGELTRIDDLIAAGRYPEALAAADEMVERGGDFHEARILRHRLSLILKNV